MTSCSRCSSRYREPTLWDAFLQYLAREGYPVPASSLSRDVTAAIEPSPEIQDLLIRIYRTDPKNAELCERLVDLDEGCQEWRYRHVKIVERTIAAKPDYSLHTDARHWTIAAAVADRNARSRSHRDRVPRLRLRDNTATGAGRDTSRRGAG